MDVEATQVIGHLGFRIDRVGISLRKELNDLRADVQALREDVGMMREDIRALSNAVADLAASSMRAPWRNDENDENPMAAMNADE